MDFAIKELKNAIRISDDGAVLVGATRMPLATILFEYLDGDSPDRIAENHPDLAFSDLFSALAYYHQHREDCEKHLDDCRRIGERNRLMAEQTGNAALRARISAARQTRNALAG